MPKNPFLNSSPKPFTMAFLHSHSLSTPIISIRSSNSHSLRPFTFTFVPKFHLRDLRNPLPFLAYSTSKSFPTTEQEVLQAVVESDEKTLPCVRTFENDLGRLTLVGAVDFQQALTAAAADGGQAAAEHIDAGIPAMVVETMYPGPSEQHSTVSTRLFLPATKVNEKAGKLRSSFTDEMLSGATSANILAMTFRQVVLEQLWNFELVIFRPGTERDMEDLENPREVSASFTLGSSDERVLFVLSEAVCIAALQSTERHFLDNYLGKAPSNLFGWLRNPRRIASKDSSVIINKLFEDEIVEHAKSLLEKFILRKGHLKPRKNKTKYSWWNPSVHSKLEKIGGPEFSSWTSEYVPAYRLQIHASQLKDVRFEGWRKSAEDRWEVLLTHSQMVGLADVIDMYYEDVYSLPNKELSCGIVANFTNLPKKKKSSYLTKMLSATLVSGLFLVTISALGQLYLPHLHKYEKFPGKQGSTLSSGVNNALHQSLDANQLEAFCISVVKKIKDAFGWPNDVIAEKDVGAWTGKLPNYLRKMVEEHDSKKEAISAFVSPSENIDAAVKISAQDIASYQVVLSEDGRIVGFQPLSRVAVNQWAANPLATELYGGRKLSPGLIDPGLKIKRPNAVFIIELLMSVKPDGYFALARPVR